MARVLVEHRLKDVSTRLKRLREELEITNEQLLQLSDEADDARLRALVSETPLAEREHREAEGHAGALDRHRRAVEDDIARLERTLDELLDRLQAG